jgi:uncharacterized protein (DUF2141 family)
MAGAQTAAKGSVAVKVTGIRNDYGNISIALRSGPTTIVQGKIAEIDTKNMTATVVFVNVAPGTYDVAVIHDENKNGHLDFNEVGMPLEGYGHSNNPAKRPGPPSFDETKFTMADQGLSLNIELVYW